MNRKSKYKHVYLDNKGFAITSIIYSMLFLFIALMTITLLTLARRKILIDKSKEYTKVLLNDYIETYDYSYTGDVQEFVAPRDGYYKIELWGAQGGSISGTGYDMNGNNRGNLTYTGGKGAYTIGDVYLSKSQIIYIYVGGKGSQNISLTKTENQDVGGYNGGGSLLSGQGVYGSTGGGATDVRITSGIWNDFNSLKSRIMVAAGGGGANFRNQGYGEGNGGAGGTLIGIDGQESLTENSYFRSDYSHGYELGTGGTQTSGGYKTIYYLNGTIENVQSCTDCLGNFGQAIQGKNQTGGGSGYYGGGSNSHGGAGGGSSFISGYDGCDAIAENSTETNIVHTGQSIHYSGIKFENSNMISGNSSVPTYDGEGTMVGNTGDGHAKITYIGNESIQPQVNFSISGFNELYLPTITDNNIGISGINITYKLDLPSSGYSFDWSQTNPAATVSFCNSNNTCEKLSPVCDDKSCIAKHGSYTTTEPGYLSLSLSGVSFSLNNIVYQGKKVKINFNNPIENSPVFYVRSGCTYSQGTFVCSNKHKSGDTASGDVYVFSPTGPFTKQFSVDGGEWKTDGGSASGYYAKISGIGSHTIKVRTKYTSGSNVIYSKESEEFVITIDKLQYTANNLIQNGSYENGITSWTNSSNNNAATISVSQDESYHGKSSLKYLFTSASGSNILHNNQTLSISKPILNHKYYGALMYKTSSNYNAYDARFEWRFNDNQNALMVFAKKNAASTSWKKLSNIITIDVDTYLGEDNNWVIRNFSVVNNPSSTQYMYVDAVMLIDLTETFGSGNEPTKEWCDENISYFDGSTIVYK